MRVLVMNSSLSSAEVRSSCSVRAWVLSLKRPEKLFQVVSSVSLRRSALTENRLDSRFDVWPSSPLSLLVLVVNRSDSLSEVSSSWPLSISVLVVKISERLEKVSSRRVVSVSVELPNRLERSAAAWSNWLPRRSDVWSMSWPSCCEEASSCVVSRSVTEATLVTASPAEVLM